MWVGKLVVQYSGLLNGFSERFFFLSSISHSMLFIITISWRKLARILYLILNNLYLLDSRHHFSVKDSLNYWKKLKKHLKMIIKGIKEKKKVLFQYD